MSYRTLEVELENGRVYPCGTELLPASGRALLTLLDSGSSAAVSTCGELAERWNKIDRLSTDEGNAFANDVEEARANLPPLSTKWD